MGFAGFSTSVDLASKVKAFFALAPITTVQHVEGALHYFAPFYKEFEVGGAGHLRWVGLGMRWVGLGT